MFEVEVGGRRAVNFRRTRKEEEEEEEAEQLKEKGPPGCCRGRHRKRAGLSGREIGVREIGEEGDEYGAIMKSPSTTCCAFIFPQYAARRQSVDPAD